MKNKLLILILVSGIIKPVINAKPVTNTMVVYVHGTLPIDKFRDKKPLKGKTFLYHPFQPITKKGLVKIDEEVKSIPSLYTSFYKTVASSLPKEDGKTSFYTFGWDGKLHERNRIKWAHKLYEALDKEVKKNTKVILLSHSHGGNVCLSLAHAQAKFKKNIKIEKLVMFGTPVQSETKKFVTSKMFKKVYNIYSKGDRIQVADIFSTYDFFSKRSFKTKKKSLPENLVEIEVKVNNKKPCHTELWLLGQVPFGLYRKKFPLYPIPIAAFTPIIISNEAPQKCNELLLQITKNGNSCSFNFQDKRSTNKTSLQFDGVNKLESQINSLVG